MHLICDYPIVLACVLFDPTIPTYDFNLFVLYACLHKFLKPNSTVHVQ